MTGAESLLEAVLQQAPDIVSVELDGETVLFEPQHESLTVLDPVGTVIWTLLDGTVPLRTLCAELADAYRAPTEQVQQDVLVLVERLAATDLVMKHTADR